MGGLLTTIDYTGLTSMGFAKHVPVNWMVAVTICYSAKIVLGLLENVHMIIRLTSKVYRSFRDVTWF